MNNVLYPTVITVPFTTFSFLQNSFVCEKGDLVGLSDEINRSSENIKDHFFGF